MIRSRDGRDVCLSYQAIHNNQKIEEKFGPKGVVANALYWIDGLRRIERISSFEIYEFRYEDLIIRPKKELTQLCEFLEVDYSPEMHQSYQQSRDKNNLLSNNLSSTIHTKLSQGLDSNNMKKYTRLMSKSAQFRFELLTAPYLKKYGYELTFPWLNNHFFTPFRAAVYFVAQKLNDFRYSRRDRKVCLPD